VATDADVAAFAASIENTLVAVYTEMAKQVDDPAVAHLVSMFGDHHQAHARSFNGLAGAKSVGGASNPKLTVALLPGFRAARDQSSVLVMAAALEDRVAATYEFALDNLRTAAAKRLTASVLPVEAQHAVVWGAILGHATRTMVKLSFEGREGFLDPSQLPVRG
jgi:rubrerythrin